MRIYLEEDVAENPGAPAVETPPSGAGEAEHGNFMFEDASESPNVEPAQPSPEDGGQPGQSPNPAEQDQQRYQYWQSQADRIKIENQKLTEQLQQLQAVAPIARYLEQKPELLDVIENDIRGVSPAAAPVKPSVPQMPLKPQRPAHYDPMEATTEAESESWKYRESLEKYNEDLVSYNASLVERQEQRYKQQQALEQQQKQVNTWVQELMTKHNYTYDSAIKFIDKYTRPESFSLGNLVMLDKISTSGNPNDVLAQQREALLRQQSANTQAPLPAAALPGGTPPAEELSEEDLFNAGLMRNKRR